MPKKMSEEDDQVCLLSSEGEKIEIDIKVAKMSETIKNLIEDTGIEDAIPLPNVNAKILKKVIEYCNHHVDNPVPVSDEEEKRTDDIAPWDANYCKVDQATLFELIMAANFLDIKPLLDLTCKTVANMIKGKGPEEIRKLFGIVNDFTPEEEEQVRKENEWVNEN